MFARSIVGWKVDNRIKTKPVLDALEQVPSDRGKLKKVVEVVSICPPGQAIFKIEVNMVDAPVVYDVANY